MKVQGRSLRKGRQIVKEETDRKTHLEAAKTLLVHRVRLVGHTSIEPTEKETKQNKVSIQFLGDYMNLGGGQWERQ